MTDGNKDQTQRNQYLISEITNANTAFLNNEEAGERRVQFFIGLLTAVIAVLAVFGEQAMKGPGDAPNDPLLNTHDFAAAAMVALMILLAFGVLTFLRIVKRDCVTEEYKAISSYRRKQLEPDDPFDVVAEINKQDDEAKTFVASVLAQLRAIINREDKARKVKAGGLAQLLAFINSVLLFLVLVLALHAWPTIRQLVGDGLTMGQESAELLSWLWTVFSLLAAIGAGVWQMKWSGRRRTGYREALKRAFDRELEKEEERRMAAVS